MIVLSMRKKVLLISLVVIFSAILSMLLAEAYIRIKKEYVTPETLRKRSLQYSPSLFSTHVFPLKEQDVKNYGYFINAKGYRGDDFSIDKGDLIRIIAYGGSAVFDRSVQEGKDWPCQVERMLKEKGISNIQVINAGIPGHATFDSFGRLFAEGHIFKPDYVLLYNAWNDIKYFPFDEPLLRRFKPYQEVKDFRISYRGKVDQVLCELSQLYVRLRWRYYNWKYRVGSEGAVEVGEYADEISELGLKQYRLNIEMFVDLARNIDAVPILITQARLVARDNSDEEKAMIRYEYQRMKHQTLVEAFTKTDEIIKEVSSSKQTPNIDASEEMSGKVEYFLDHVHLNGKGSQKLASIISEYLFDQIE